MLLTCCGDGQEQSRGERLAAALAAPLSEENLADLADQHGVLPLVLDRLSENPGHVPQELYRALRQRWESSTQRALWLTGELLRILQYLASEKIEVLPCKGPVLAQFLYGDVARRQFTDLDLLVHTADLPRLKDALRGLGYQPGLTLNPREERYYVQTGYEYVFDGPRGRNLLELHWQVVPRFYSIRFDVEQFFDRAITISLAGERVRSLAPDDLLLFLCVHAAKHAWVQLGWICDIAKLADHRDVDWQRVGVEARRLGIERIVGISLGLVHDLLGQTPPPAMQSVVEQAGSRISEVVSTIAAGEYDFESPAYFSLIMNIRERRLDRVRFFWRLASTPSVGEWSAIRLPGPLFFFYPVVRACRLARRMLHS